MYGLNIFTLLLISCCFIVIIQSVPVENDIENLHEENCKKLCMQCGCLGFYCGEECICDCDDTIDRSDAICLSELKNKHLKMKSPFELLIQGPTGNRFTRELKIKEENEKIARQTRSAHGMEENNDDKYTFNVEETKPSEVVGAPAPDPVVGAPAPDPVVGAPAPGPVVGAPAPEPVVGMSKMAEIKTDIKTEVIKGQEVDCEVVPPKKIIVVTPPKKFRSKAEIMDKMKNIKKFQPIPIAKPIPKFEKIIIADIIKKDAGKLLIEGKIKEEKARAVQKMGKIKAAIILKAGADAINKKLILGSPKDVVVGNPQDTVVGSPNPSEKQPEPNVGAPSPNIIVQPANTL